MEPEVHVRGTRRRRTESAPAQAARLPNVRNWLIYGGVTTLVAALMVDGFLSHRPQRPPLPDLSQAAEVRSAVTESADSLQVVVSWDLTLSAPDGRPDSMRIKVAGERQQDSLVSRKDSLIAFQPGDQFADTVYLPAPSPGQTVRGSSCVGAEHEGEPLEESCTPWQYVRPTAVAAAAGPVFTRIVIQPSGLQVDPDLDGKCARWQQSHPGESVWIQVNRMAVVDCTGPNLKPTVAQFCAFAVLPDGRRVKTANSANNDYCEELFEAWSREQYS